MKVIVTGAAGWVGRWIVQTLNQNGHTVLATGKREIDFLAPDASAKTAEFLEHHRPEWLIHCAWTTEHGKFWTAKENLQWIESSLALARHFAKSGGNRSIWIGSGAEYGWHEGHVDEQTPRIPRTPYGASKYALQQALSWYPASLRGSSSERAPPSIAWARLFLLHGPGEGRERLVPTTCRALLRGEPTRCGSGNPFRDVMHIEDAARAIVAVLQAGLEGTVNIGYGVPVQIAGVVDALAEISGRPDLARFGDLPDPPGESQFLVPDISRLASIGFRPKWSFLGGLRNSFNSWRPAVTD